MATGFTEYIENGKVNTGKDFLKICVRGMSICTPIRNEPLDRPIPEMFTEDNYYYEKYIEVKERCEFFRNMTFEEAQACIEKEYEENKKSIKILLAEKKKHNAAYKKIRNEVEMWSPPTEKHESLKKFALDQIDMSVDDDIEYYERQLSEEKPKPEEWLSLRIRHLEYEVERHHESWNAEKKRAENLSLWVRQLKESLDGMEKCGIEEID